MYNTYIVCIYIYIYTRVLLALTHVYVTTITVARPVFYVRPHRPLDYNTKRCEAYCSSFFFPLSAFEKKKRKKQPCHLQWQVKTNQHSYNPSIITT